MEEEKNAYREQCNALMEQCSSLMEQLRQAHGADGPPIELPPPPPPLGFDGPPQRSHRNSLSSPPGMGGLLERVRSGIQRKLDGVGNERGAA